ncbi:MAG: TIGR00282 family metallophosphoesterase [Salinispira sp.]
MTRTILAIGDIIGQPGARALFALLAGLKKQYRADITIVNGENACNGFGLTPELADTIFNSGADVISTGNHIWDQKEIYRYLDDQPNILRPANYPSGNPGKGSCIVKAGEIRYAVVNLQGRERMAHIDCPFKKATELLRKLSSQADVFIIDFHADDAQEKEAMAYYLDGQATLFFGTHTHIQTADQRILPKGTAYISDIGASGPENSIIGFDSDIGIRRSITYLPLKNEVSTSPTVICGIVVTFDDEKPLRAQSIKTIRVPMDMIT